MTYNRVMARVGNTSHALRPYAEFASMQLETRLGVILTEYHDFILNIDKPIVQTWGMLRVPHAENALYKLIAATAIVNGLTVITRNAKDYHQTGVKVFNPFN